jgi:Domain of unknown function (DUF4262)
MSRSTPRNKRSLSSRPNRHKRRAEVAQSAHGLTRLQKWEDDKLKKYGWYAHYAFPSGDPARDRDSGLEPGLPKEFINAHTHGFPEKFGVPDLQIVLPVSVELTQRIFWAVHNRYAEGKVLGVGVPVEGVFEKVPVMLVPAKDGDRLVHRIVIPDSQGRLWDDPDCEPGYTAQVNAQTGFPGTIDEGEAA